ncbi:MAG TPA: sigma-70 factor domain-containing protein, partial [Methylomirabilota bacterium]|nr:sigma-70 factor domain-containing protein [Methylomirabilota bacterium]
MTRPGRSWDPGREWRRRAIAWGVLPVSRLRLPLRPPAPGDPVAPAPRGLDPGSPDLLEAAAEDVEVEQALGRSAWAKRLEAAEEPPLGAPPHEGVAAVFEESEEVEEAVRPPEDPVARYFREIGRARLLTAAQEIELGQRIEAGQTELRQTLGAVPAAVAALGRLADRMRAKEASVDELVVFPETAEPTVAETRSAAAALGRLARLARTAEELERTLRRPRLSQASRVTARRRLALARRRLPALLSSLRLKPSILDGIVADLESRDERIRALEAEPATAARARTLAALERELGMPCDAFRQLLARVRAHDGAVREARRQMIEANLRLVVSVAK